MTYDTVRSYPTHLNFDMYQISNEQVKRGVCTHPAEYADVGQNCNVSPESRAISFLRTNT